MPLPLGTCSIGGVTFRVPVDQPYLPMPVTEVIEERTHIPYSNINYVDSGGLGVSIWASSVEVAAADRDTFEGLQGETGLTFVLYGTTQGPARLMITAASVWVGQGDVHYRYDIEIIF